MSYPLPALSTAPRASSGRLFLLALVLVVTAAHVWLLAPRDTFAPRPLVTWRVRWVAVPEQEQAQMPVPASAPAQLPAPVVAVAPNTGTEAPSARRAPSAQATARAADDAPTLAQTTTTTASKLSADAASAMSAAASESATEATTDATSGTVPDAAPNAVPNTTLTAADPAPTRLPPAVTLRYRVTGARRGVAVTGESVLLWSPDATAYRAAWALDSPQLGHREQTSAGALHTSGLAPTRYGERQRGEQAAHFEPASQRVRFSANTPDAPWLAGMQDPLSSLLQLAALLAAAPDRYPAGSAISLPTAGARDAAQAQWQVEGDAPLEIGGQTVDCLKLRRDPAGLYGSRVELWLARAAHYLPARLRVTRFNGDVVEQTVLDWPPEP